MCACQKLQWLSGCVFCVYHKSYVGSMSVLSVLCVIVFIRNKDGLALDTFCVWCMCLSETVVVRCVGVHVFIIPPIPI